MPLPLHTLRPRTALNLDPRTIDGLVAWFDADQISAADLDVNGNVETWQNLGTGGDATNTITNNRPTPTANGLNGRQVLTFDGSNDRLSWSASSYADASLFVVSSQTVGASGSARNMRVISAGANAGQTGYIRNQVNNNNAASQLDFAVGGFTTGTNRILYTWQTSGYGAGNGPSYGPTVLACLWSSAGMILRQNGVQRGTATTPGSLQPSFIGADAANGNLMTGYVAEILIYTPRISATQVEFVERYLGAKWGITI